VAGSMMRMALIRATFVYLTAMLDQKMPRKVVP